MLVKTKTACVTCPRLFVSGSARPPIGAKNARKMCENESMRKTRSVGSFGFDFFGGMCPDDKESQRRVTSYGRTRLLQEEARERNIWRKALSAAVWPSALLTSRYCVMTLAVRV